MRTSASGDDPGVVRQRRQRAARGRPPRRSGRTRDSVVARVRHQSDVDDRRRLRARRRRTRDAGAPGGATITLSSNNPAAQVPASVNIAAGNSATTFTVAPSAVGSFTSATITGSSGASTREAFLDIVPDPNAGPQLASVIPGVTSATGGSDVTATVTLTGAAPSGGASITMATSSTKAQAPPIVTVPAGQTSATFTMTTSTVTQNTVITVTGTFGNGSKSGSFTLVPATAGDTAAPTV